MSRLTVTTPATAGALFPVIYNVVTKFAPLPLTLAWHVAAYAMEVVTGMRDLTKYEVEIYLDEVTFAGMLIAKRPAPAAFVAMVRAHMNDLGPSDPAAPVPSGRSTAGPTASNAIGKQARVLVPCRAAVLCQPANDNAP